MVVGYILIGLLFFLLAGLMYLAQGKSGGSWYGIRTPQTLGSPEVWQKVHQQAWKPLFFSGLALYLVFFVALMFKQQENPFLCLVATMLAFIISGFLLSRLVKRVASEEKVDISENSENRFEEIMFKQVKMLKLAGYITAFILILLAAALPFIASSGPNDVFGIRTDVTMNSPEIWSIVHLRAALPTLIGGLAIALMSFLVMRSNWRPTTRLWCWAVMYFTILGMTARFAIWW